MSRLKFYLKRAKEAEVLAQSADDPWMKENWLEIAKIYRQLAQFVSQ